ncbi:LuxR C-terminal-related transcriptional regulator [Micromonospora sp. M12]
MLLPISTDGRAQVVASTGDAAAAAALVSRHRPDLVLVDLHAAARRHPAVAAIRRTTRGYESSRCPVRATRARRGGAAGRRRGFLPKTSEPEELLRPLLAILDGWAVLPAELLRAMLRPARATPDLDGEERRLLRAIASGRTTVDIGEELHVSERTVKRMTAALLRKLRVSSRAEAAAVAGHSGMLAE